MLNNGFALNINLIPALLSEGIEFGCIDSVHDTLKIIVMHNHKNICKVEAIQELCTSYCYKVIWAHSRDNIRFHSNYKHFTTLINDIKMAIKDLEKGEDNNMNKKMYRVTNAEFRSSPSQMDEMTFTVNVLNSRCAIREDYDRIKETIEGIKTHEDSIDALMYCKADVISTYRLVQMFNKTSIKDVIFNNPATIVLWADGTKTVVKAENEPFDPEKGLAMAIAKRALGGKYDYYDTFKKYVGKYEKKQKKGGK